MQRQLTDEALKQSQERYQAFIAQSTEGIWRFELEKPVSIIWSVKKQIAHVFRYAYLAECNDAMARMYGYKKAKEITGARLADMLIPSDPDNIAYLTAFINSNYKLNNRESREVDRYGKLRIFENNLVGIIEKGFVLRAWGTQRDITKQKQEEERTVFLEKLNTKLVSSFDHHVTLQEIAQLLVPFLADYCRIAIIDEKKTIKEIAVNHQDPTQVTLVKQLFNSYKDLPRSTYGIPSILRKGKPEIIPEITDARLEKMRTSPKVMKIVKQLGLKSYMGVPLIARNKVIGAMTFSSVQATRYYTKQDLRFMEEIARRIALTLDNIRLYQEAQEAITLRDDFISVASHELKTPLTSVKIFTQVLQQHASQTNDTKAAQSLAKMDRQIDKLTELIYNMLNIAKIESGRMEFAKKEFSFDQMVYEVTDVLQHITTRHKLIIVGKTKKLVQGDEDRIGQVLSNLISNAIKYSPHADKVVITLSAQKKQISVSVQDFGIGMDKQHLDKIFNRFYRVSGATDKTFPGLGIGLYISKEIIERHGGKLWAESTLGKGSTFFFTLPM